MVQKFEDLEFAPHANGMDGAVQSQHIFPNGITLSIVGGGYGVYGNGIETFEVGAFKKGHEWIKLSEYDDVVGWQTKEDINAIIQKLNDM